MMAIERTLAMVKPDGVKKDVWYPIMRIYGNNITGLDIRRTKIFQPSERFAKEFYREHEGRPYFSQLIEHMTSGINIALEIEGEGAIHKIRELNGDTNPAKAELGTIRRLWGDQEGGPRNVVHGSDSPASAERELSLVFGEQFAAET